MGLLTKIFRPGTYNSMFKPEICAVYDRFTMGFSVDFDSFFTTTQPINNHPFYTGICVYLRVCI